MNMTRKYYIQNLLVGALLAAIFCYVWRDDGRFTAVAIFSVVHALLFPFSILLVETIALKFTRREFWSRGFFIDTPAKSGLYAFYYLFVFVLALPFALIYLIVAAIKGPG